MARNYFAMGPSPRWAGVCPAIPSLSYKDSVMPDWLFWGLVAVLPVLLIVFFVVRKKQQQDD